MIPAHARVLVENKTLQHNKLMSATPDGVLRGMVALIGASFMCSQREHIKLGTQALHTSLAAAAMLLLNQRH